MQDSVMKKAFKEWEGISRDPRAWAQYESRRKAVLDEAAAVREAELRAQEAEERGMARGMAQGVAIGEAIGVQKASEDIARNLLASGMDLATVAQHTGLSKERVAELRQ